MFPSTEISGYNCHFNHALWQKDQNIGLVDEYRNNEEEIRLHIRICAALALILLDDIDKG